MTDSGGANATDGEQAARLSADRPADRVAVVGGGLAGMAAAVALQAAGCRVSLLESRRYLGGRASSFREPRSGDWVDLCQHVSMGCCTNLSDFCRRTGISQCFRRERVLHFFDPDGRRFDLQACSWLPPPLHLGPSLWRLKYLSAADRIGIGRALLRLARLRPGAAEPEPTIGAWLRANRQSPIAIERFWQVVLVSALGESLERASLSAARKVFVDGFMAAREAYVVEVPDVSLGEIYDGYLRRHFADQRIELLTETTVRAVEIGDEILDGRFTLTTTGGSTQGFDAAILAVPWRHIGALVGPKLAARLPWLAGVRGLASSPISSVHLWFDRTITQVEHAVLVGRTSQWVFHRRQGDGAAAESESGRHRRGEYYQVVISASAEMAAIGPEALIQQVLGDLHAVFPAARAAQLVHARVVTDPHAVFSVSPEAERLRPAQKTAVPGLAVAGDWTATGWPATMEGAVRSGYLAAEAILADLGRTANFLRPDLPRSLLARWLIRRDE